MRFFTKKPPYSLQELHSCVLDMDNLAKLRDSSIQKTIVTKVEDELARYKLEVLRYTANIETCQRFYEHMVARNGKV